MNDQERLNIDGARPLGAVAVGIKPARRRCENLGPATNRTPDSGPTVTHHRLPGCDQPTQGSEFAVFVGLGLVALTLIGASFAGSLQFALQRDAIMAAVAGENPHDIAANPQRAKTNVAAADSRVTPQPTPTPACPSAQKM